MEDYKEPEFAAQPSATEPYCVLETLKGGVLIAQMPLKHSPVFIGRAPVCEVEMQHASVSRFHCVLQYSRDGRWYLRDLNSTHGTRVNKVKIGSQTGDYVPLPHGSFIQVGESTRAFVLQYPQRLESEPVEAIVPAGDSSDVVVDEAEELLRKIPKEQARKELEKWLRRNGYDDHLTIVFSASDSQAHQNRSQHQNHSNQNAVGLGKQYTANLSLSVFTGNDAEYLNVRGVGRDKDEAANKASFAAIKELIVLGVYQKKRQESKVKRSGSDDSSDEEVLDVTGGGPDVKKMRREDSEESVVFNYEMLVADRKALYVQLRTLEEELLDAEAEDDDNQKQFDAKEKQDGPQEEDDEFEQFMSQIEEKVKTGKVETLNEQINQVNKELERVNELIDLVKP